MQGKCCDGCMLESCLYGMMSYTKLPCVILDKYNKIYFLPTVAIETRTTSL